MRRGGKRPWGGLSCATTDRERDGWDAFHRVLISPVPKLLLLTVSLVSHSLFNTEHKLVFHRRSGPKGSNDDN